MDSYSSIQKIILLQHLILSQKNAIFKFSKSRRKTLKVHERCFKNWWMTKRRCGVCRARKFDKWIPLQGRKHFDLFFPRHFSSISHFCFPSSSTSIEDLRFYSISKQVHIPNISTNIFRRVNRWNLSDFSSFHAFSFMFFVFFSAFSFSNG